MQSKTITQALLAALAAGASFFAVQPAAAQNMSPLTGEVGAMGGVRTCGNSDDSACEGHFAWDVNGRAAVHFGNIGIQGDAHYESYEDPEDEGDQVQSTLVLGGHLSYMTEHYLVGVFAAGARMDVDEEDEWGEIYGGEIQRSWDRVTAYGQVGWADIKDQFDDSQFEGWFARLVGRIFVSDDFMFEGEVGYGYSDDYEDTGNSQWGEVINWGLSSKFRITDRTPIYGTIRYQGGSYTANNEDDGSENSLLFGVSFMFGSDSLYANNQTGANLDLPMLPARGANWAQALD